MMNILNLFKRPNSMATTLKVNGKLIEIEGDSISIEVSGNLHYFNVEVNGALKIAKVNSFDIMVNGNVGELKVKQGDVSCKDVTRNVSTEQGDVTCGNVGGNVRTEMGDIKYRR